MACCGQTQDTSELKVVGYPNGAEPVAAFVVGAYVDLRPGLTYTQLTGSEVQHGFDWGYLEHVDA